MMKPPEPMLDVNGLTFRYREKPAVDNVGFSICPGETFGIVGESGSGKTTLVKLLLRLLTPEAGQIRMFGEDVLGLTGNALLQYRKQVQVVFQDPYGSINPWMTVGSFIGEPLRIQGIKQDETEQRVAAILPRVGLSPDIMQAYPHRFSGGQRQRMAIARALITEPRFLLCDEPVSALDVSIQSQILNLFKDIQDETGLTYLFVSHNLAVIRQMADHIGVMLAGKLVEVAPAEDFFAQPLHPYSVLLLQAVPLPDPSKGVYVPPELPELPDAPQGCPFYNRCDRAFARCSAEAPARIRVSERRQVACHLFNASPTTQKLPRT